MTQHPSPRDWVRQAGNIARIPCIEAYFQGHGYAPHRHDTYAIGRTLSGVQSFRYRSEHRHSLPGQTLVLHPDELHDGHAGTGDGFRYRMVYVPPALLQSMLGGRPLPFVPGGITSDPRLAPPVEALLRRMDAPLDPWKKTTRSSTWPRRCARCPGRPAGAAPATGKPRSGPATSCTPSCRRLAP